MSTEPTTTTTESGDDENLATAVTEVSERVTLLIREEIELAKVETIAKITSLARGVVAGIIGAVFGVFALIFGLETLAWGLNSPIAGTGKIWIGFIITTALLVMLAVAAFLFAWRNQSRSAHARYGDRRGQEDPRDRQLHGAVLMPAARTPQQIRASIEQNRRELGTSLEKLRGEVVRATDWRGQMRRHRMQVVVGAVVAGSRRATGFAAITTLASGGRRRARSAEHRAAASSQMATLYRCRPPPIAFAPAEGGAGALARGDRV